MTIIKGNLNRNNNLDILRLFFALFVFLGHWTILTNFNSDLFILHFEVTGVDGFFIISGFLVFWSYHNDQNTKNFFIKRFFRIYPLYGIIILIQSLFFIFLSNGTVWENIRYFIANIFYLNFLQPTVGTIFDHLTINAINGSLWSLKIEVMFYLMVPLLYRIIKKWGIKVVFITYILSIIYTFLASHYHLNILIRQLPGKFRFFAVGILLFMYFDRITKINSKTMLSLVISSIILLYLFLSNNIFNVVIYPFCLGILILYIAFYIKQLKISSDFSYSIYVIHFPIIQIALLYQINLNKPLFSLLFFTTLIFILSFLSEKYLEKKFIQTGKKIIKNSLHTLNGS